MMAARRPRLILVLSALSALCLVIALWRFYELQRRILHDEALRHAQAYSRALAEFRTLYTSAVVRPLRELGDVDITHDFTSKPRAIPLPATLTILLGERLGQDPGTGKISLYSPYPFPWRSDTGGLRDAFQKDAWAALSQHHEVAFYRVETLRGQPTLRYATADLLRAPCVDCHNQHPDSPRRGWKEGDLRGVLEVEIPLASALGAMRRGIGVTLPLLVVGMALGLSGVAILLRRHGDAARRLAQATHQANTALAAEVRERQQAEELLRGAQKDLHAAVEQLARSNRELDEFAQVAAHDLKEPLRGIQNYSRFLVEDYGEGQVLDTDGRAKLDTLERLAGRLQSLIDNLLQYSRVGRVELSFGATDLGSVVHEVVASLSIRLDEQKVTVRVAADLPTVKCDRARVGEIFRNLISNAMKFNDKAERWIEVGWLEPPGGPPVFFVRDNGIGIAAEHLGSVFRMFKRLHPRDAYGGGTGAGLSIAQRIVERHGGRLWVESVPGEGTIFRFTLAPAEA